MSTHNRRSESSASSSDTDDQAMSPRSPVYDNGSRSPRPFELPASESSTRQSTLGPAATRLRQAVLKVIHIQKSTTKFHNVGAGAEPGVDPRRHTATELYGHMRQECDIKVIDYSSVRSTTRTFDNEGLRAWIARGDNARPAWGKVRWIHVNGMDWGVLSTLAIEHSLHPLALEDVLHSHAESRSKASYFTTHLFLRVMAHQAAIGDPQEQGITDLPRSSSPAQLDDDEDADDAGDSRPALFRFRPRSSTYSTRKDIEANEATFDTTKTHHWQHPDEDLQRRADRAELHVIKDEEDRTKVSLNNLCIFLWRDGTVLSIFAKPKSDFAAPIVARLKSRDTILRATADPSLLVQSMLDLVVDQALEVVDRYHTQLTKLEASVLVKPRMTAVRSLHILSGDLALRKRSLEPIKALIFGLRRYDLDRCAALSEDSKEKAVGFMSHKAKIYLADVLDHMDYILSSVDLFTTISENLISYTFNMSNYYTSQTMRLLTLVTIIFMPLTLLTGYFGMNFKPFPGVENHSDVLFWIIALPALSVIIPLFLWSDIRRMTHYVRKTESAKKVSQAIKAGRTPSRAGTL